MSSIRTGFRTIPELEAHLSEPSPQAVDTVRAMEGDIAVLGAGGKMGPTLALMLKSAAPKKKVYAVSRFTDAEVRSRLDAAGVLTVSADLLDRSSYAALPKAPNVYFLAGMKFGASGNQPMTWAMNSYLPALVCEAYRESRILAFSTGNVYPLATLAEGGATEDREPGPIGEYAQSCLGRERIFQYFSAKNGTPVVVIRLNYANEPRYGVLVDLTQKILAGMPVDLTMGYVNVIWQQDANDYIARAITLASSPASVLNVAGPETLSVRSLALLLGTLLGKEPLLAGSEAQTALLSSAARCFASFGYPRTPLLPMVDGIVDWVKRGMPVLGKPTKFQVRDGHF